MDRFQEMQVFVRVADRQSFSLASEDLHIPRATVTNLIKRLEERLGVRLLERTTRQVRLTHEGDAYYQRCVRLLSDLQEIESSFHDAPPKGLLRVNLQGTLAKHFVLPSLGDFLSQYPDIILHINEDDRLVDLVREGFDCVLRAGVLQDSTLISRQIALMEQVTVVSPTYLQQYGKPTSIDDLECHFAVDYVSSITGRPMSLDFMKEKEVVSLKLKSKISVTGADFYTGAAISGLGIIQVPRYRIEKELATNALCIILPNAPPPPMPVSVVYLQNRQLSPRVRVFTQWVAKQFEEHYFSAH